MKYNVEIEFLQDGEMEKLEYCISDIELLDKFIPVEAIALLASFGMDYQIDELKEVVQEEGFADNDNDETTRTITEYLKKENINFEFKYDRHQEQRESYMDAHMGGYHEAVARNGGSNIFTYNVTVSKFKGITIYI